MCMNGVKTDKVNGHSHHHHHNKDKNIDKPQKADGKCSIFNNDQNDKVNEHCHNKNKNIDQPQKACVKTTENTAAIDKATEAKADKVNGHGHCHNKNKNIDQPQKACVKTTESTATVDKAAEAKPEATIAKTIVSETEDKIITGQITAEIKPTETKPAETTSKIVVTETDKTPVSKPVQAAPVTPAPISQPIAAPTYQAPQIAGGFENMFSQLGLGSNGFSNFMGFGANSFGSGMPTSGAMNSYAAPAFNTGGPIYKADATATFGNPTSNIFNLGAINTPISVDNNNPMLSTTYGQVDQFIGMINSGMFPNQQSAYNYSYPTQSQGYQIPQQQYYPQQAQMPAPQGTASGQMDLGSMMGMLQQMLTTFQQAQTN